MQIATELDAKLPALQAAVTAVQNSGDAEAIKKAEQAVRNNRIERMNQIIDSVVVAIFLVLVILIVVLSVREWMLLLARKKLATLRESEPVWLPEYSIVEAKPLHLVGLIALGFALLKEVSGEAHLDRAQQQAAACNCVSPGQNQVRVNLLQGGTESCDQKTARQVYVEATEKKFNGINRCC